MTTRDEFAPVEGLGAAFLRRDVGAALDWFLPDDDIGYIGSEEGERANGRAAVGALFESLFARPVAYGWTVREGTVHRRGEVAFVYVDALGEEDGPDGTQTFPYRLSGLVELRAGRWRWRVCQGAEPTPAG